MRWRLRRERRATTGASTGPRPRGRGMARRRRQGPHRSSRFNGAAPARARNVAHSRIGTPWLPKLQRGRARAGAECARRTAGLIRRNRLQRGRARAGAEWFQVSTFKFQPSKLQRGRARAGAEWFEQALNLHNGRMASTGPRPRGRGMTTPQPRRVLPLPASTGPRPRGRGMRPAMSRGRHWTGCFNGAAPARARNEQTSFTNRSRSPGFNGAAPARARNGHGRGRREECQARLQRGRARAGAECCPVEAVQPRRMVASTGPRPRGRGMRLARAQS